MAGGMSLVQYLTVQDMLWIHLQLAKRVEPFDYARMEDGTYYQYAYGKSVDIPAQAGRFLKGFAEKAPFETCNEATAFVAGLAFLRLNGYHVHIKDHEALSWYRGLCSHAQPGEALRHRLEMDPHHDDHEPAVRESVLAVIEEFPETIRELLKPNLQLQES